MYQVMKNGRGATFATIGEVRNRCALNNEQVKKLQENSFLVANGYKIWKSE